MTDGNTNINNLPPYLESYGSLLSHLEGQFATLKPHEKSEEKGDRFVDFVLRLIPHLEIAQDFDRPQKNKRKSHDKGVDIIANSKAGLLSSLIIQSKYSIPETQELDSILSKFQSFDAEMRGQKPNEMKNLSLFSESTEVDISNHFVIVTASDLKTIRQRYERSQMSSRSFYDKLMRENRLHIVDGPALFPIIRTAYRKQSILPTNVILPFTTAPIHIGDVFIGVVQGSQLKSLYEEFGNSLFLENIREFLGQASGRINLNSAQVSVNKEIARTLKEEPEKFLSRNNGITFRSGSVEIIDGSTLKLNDASIVNGCQTTMSIVQNPTDDALILVKVVRSNDSWDIAEAANFQNEIRQLDLRLARYIRPQEIRKYTSKANIGFRSASDEASAFALLDSFYEDEITYEEVRSLFIGLFSNTPNNAIDTNYTKLRSDVIGPIFEDHESKDQIFEVLFKIHSITQEAARQIEKMSIGTEDADLFRRFWSGDKPNYRAFLAILAICGCLQQNIYADEAIGNHNDMLRFLQNVQKIIDQKPEIFIRYYRNSFLVVSFDVERPDINPDKIVHVMYRSIESADFRNLYSRLRRLSRNDETLSQLETQ